MGPIRVLLMTLAFLLCASPQTTHAEEAKQGADSLQHRPYFEGWMRIDANLPLYQSHNPSGMHIGLIVSGHFVYTAPGIGPRFTGLLGLSASDNHFLFSLYSGGSFSEEIIRPGNLPLRTVAGLRINVLLPHHADLLHETMFFFRKDTPAEVLSQTELLSPPLDHKHLVALGLKSLIEGNAENPRADFKLLVGPQLSVWLLNDTLNSSHTKKLRPKVRVDAAYKIGPFWNENRVDVAHELEAELLIIFGSN